MPQDGLLNDHQVSEFIHLFFKYKTQIPSESQHPYTVERGWKENSNPTPSLLWVNVIKKAAEALT